MQTDPADGRAITVPMNPVNSFQLTSSANKTSGIRMHPTSKQRPNMMLLRDRWDLSPYRWWRSFFKNDWLGWAHLVDSASNPTAGCQLSRYRSGRTTLRRWGHIWSLWVQLLQGSMLVGGRAVHSLRARMLLTQGSTAASGQLNWGLWSKSHCVCFAHTMRLQWITAIKMT